jgi:hypothetical protein
MSFIGTMPFLGAAPGGTNPMLQQMSRNVAAEMIVP